MQCNEGGKSVMFASSFATSGGYFIPVILVYPSFIKSHLFALNSFCSTLFFSGTNSVAALLTISGCLVSHCCSNSSPENLVLMLACEELVHAVTTVTFTSIIYCMLLVTVTTKTRWAIKGKSILDHEMSYSRKHWYQIALVLYFKFMKSLIAICHH